MEYKTYHRTDHLLSMDDYQERAVKTAIYPKDTLKAALSYTALGLNGEAGEVAEKIKKYIRGDKTIDREATAMELGDVLWYTANMANELGFTLSQIANMNIKKLTDRTDRGVIHGDGDNR